MKNKKYVQIRVNVEHPAYENLKKEAKEIKMDLQTYAGFRLSGYRIIKEEKTA